MVEVLNITIRRAKANDAGLLADLGARTFSETFAADNTAEDMAAYLASSFNVAQQTAELADSAATFLVAEVDGVAAGYAKLHAGKRSEKIEGPNPVELVRLYVSRQWLGRGVGDALIRACVDEAQQAGHETIWLGVWERNARAQAFYRKWNFRAVGEHAFQLGADLQNDILMELHLNERSTRLPATASPIHPEGLSSASERLEFIDSLRGFALFGVFWANLLIFAGIGYLTDEQRNLLFTSRLDSIAFFFERFFIENKFMGLFSFLFGISFWLFLSRARARGGSANSLFYRRIFWLFVIGAIHGWLLWAFDILRFYALWAVLLPLFVRTAPRRLLSIALVTSILIPAVVSGLRVWLITPAEPATNFDAMALAAFSSGSYREFLIANWKYDWYLTLTIGQISYQVAVLGRLLLGLYVARTFSLDNLGVHRKLLLRVLIVGGLVGLLGSTIFAGELLTGGATSPLLSFIRRVLLESGQLGLTLCYAAGLALIFLTIRGKRLVRLLAPIGRMALTWYLLQTVFGIWMFYGFAPGPGLMGKVGAAALMAIAFVGFVVQVVCARAWLKWFRFGPAEWLWRSLTYWKLQPLK